MSWFLSRFSLSSSSFFVAGLFGGNVFVMLIVVTILVLNLSWLIPYAVFYFMYRTKLPVFEQYKIQV